MDDAFKSLRTPEYSKFIYKSRYARWLLNENRRENWDETVDRYIAYFKEYCSLDEKTCNKLREYIFNFKVMPSMRALMTAGPALARDNVAGYNCAAIAIDDPKAFDEILYVLACGTGVGFSVERQYVQKLPIVAEEFFDTETIIIPRDSKLGWASAYRELISLLYEGRIPKWDFSKIRPSGAPLKIFGGRASGPEPLDQLFRFTIEVFRRANGRQLSSIECHDIVCKIAETIVVGGVRRSALISLSNLSDQRMSLAKSGSWWLENPQRALANNSVAYTEKPDVEVFMREWLNLIESRSGERGVYNRYATNKLIPERRKELGYTEWLCNPCSEINLRASGQMCNLSEVIVRPEDTLQDLLDKVEVATILGTLQATQTNFRYLRKQWQRNCEEESLLGVSLTGIMDHPILSNECETKTWRLTQEGSEYLDQFYGDRGDVEDLTDVLVTLRERAKEVNVVWAEKLGINTATAITCVKPSGTVSKLTDTASGIHPRYSPYYISTVRADNKDPLAIMMSELGVPVEKDVMKPESGLVFSFPMASPESSIFRDDRTAIEQLELWKIYQLYWCEHKPSVTIYVKDNEWFEVGAWIYNNFDIVSGVSFLPHSNHTYAQAPYQEVTKEVFLKLKEGEVSIDYGKLSEYEKVDSTTSTKELACIGGACEI